MEPKTGKKMAREEYPGLKLMSFTWEERGYYRLYNDFHINDFHIDGGNLQTILEYSVWESQIFGDRWEVDIEFAIMCLHKRGPFPYFLKWTQLDRTRPLCLGETFRAVRKTPMTRKEKERRQGLIQQGEIEFKSHVPAKRFEQALRQLVWECVAIPVNERNLTPAKKLARFRWSMEKQAAGEHCPRGRLWPHIAEARASTEPLQAQEAVLLRAAQEGQESRVEELVRASVGWE